MEKYKRLTERRNIPRAVSWSITPEQMWWKKKYEWDGKRWMSVHLTQLKNKYPPTLRCSSFLPALLPSNDLKYCWYLIKSCAETSNNAISAASPVSAAEDVRVRRGGGNGGASPRLDGEGGAFFRRGGMGAAGSSDMVSLFVLFVLFVWRRRTGGAGPTLLEVVFVAAAAALASSLAFLFFLIWSATDEACGLFASCVVVLDLRGTIGGGVSLVVVVLFALVAFSAFSAFSASFLSASFLSAFCSAAFCCAALRSVRHA